MGTGISRNYMSGMFMIASVMGAFEDRSEYFHFDEYNYLRHLGGKKAKIRRFYGAYPQGECSRYYEQNCVEIYARTAAQATAIFTKKMKSEDDFILLYIKQQQNLIKYHGKAKNNR